MKTKLKFVAALAGVLSLWFASALSLRAADQITRFNATPGSKMRVEGTSTIHDWRAESPIIAGFIEVGPNFPTQPGQNVSPGKVAVHGKAEGYARAVSAHWGWMQLRASWSRSRSCGLRRAQARFCHP